LSSNDQANELESDSEEESKLLGRKWKPSASSKVVVLLTPPPARAAATSTTATTSDNAASPSAFIKRVQKKAFHLSQKTFELGDTEDPNSSPVLVAKSPYASKVFHALADTRAQPAVASYIMMYHESNPEADSQEAYNVASDFMRDLDGKPKKK
jgi:hypothetical protein